MLRKLAPMVAVAIVATALIAAARPPTPTPPTIGVPHVVSVTETVPAGTPQPRTIACPAGEAALSFAYDYSNHGLVANYRPIVTSGMPTGYEFWVDDDNTITAYVTCAPINR